MKNFVLGFCIVTISSLVVFPQDSPNESIKNENISINKKSTVVDKIKTDVIKNKLDTLSLEKIKSINK